MWEERKPIAGETVKIEFAAWTGMGTQIGIYLGTFDGKAKIHWPSNSIPRTRADLCLESEILSL